jgi:hypothetical protein
VRLGDTVFLPEKVYCDRLICKSISYLLVVKEEGNEVKTITCSHNLRPYVLPFSSIRIGESYCASMAYDYADDCVRPKIHYYTSFLENPYLFHKHSPQW